MRGCLSGRTFLLCVFLAASAASCPLRAAEDGGKGAPPVGGGGSKQGRAGGHRGAIQASGSWGVVRPEGRSGGLCMSIATSGGDG